MSQHQQCCFASQVEVAVKAGLVLVAVSIARSLLGVRLVYTCHSTVTVQLLPAMLSIFAL